MQLSRKQRRPRQKAALGKHSLVDADSLFKGIKERERARRVEEKKEMKWKRERERES